MPAAHALVGELGESGLAAQEPDGDAVGRAELRLHLRIGIAAQAEGPVGEILAVRAALGVDDDFREVLAVESVLASEFDGGLREGMRVAATGELLDAVAFDLEGIARLLPHHHVGGGGLVLDVDAEEPGLTLESVLGAGDVAGGQRRRPERAAGGEGRLHALGQRLLEKRLSVAAGLRVVDAHGEHRLIH